ncbi:LOW QUALITY PROTEIN: transmembrane and ubiquitin-like domain-containing protein 1 [Myiozetetes cayanensis]|uniref:LOW QUALITY PROTEIN: transmembrane and ubiquitin-like domain-containing protein 1 n=1 Tax=Myiozetetes cayanensis TaxID=478635 RepID=UPI00215FF989|nr:LOW QUALITY PROTEIN: transmembrane and ubiquitin-like domain-containing protein 1 [Myiozetetes cayanensis]
MALIEGVGDEVTVLFALLVAAAVLGLAWASTRAPEPAAPPPEAGPSAAPTERKAPAPAAAPAEGAAAPDEAAGLRHREPPAAAPEGPAEPTLVLRLKFLNDTERLARVRPGDTVGALKRTYFPGQEQQVRLIYQGQLLRDDAQSLAGLHLGHLSVLHCHLSPPSAAPAAPGPPAPAPAPAALGVGSLALPLFVLLLALLWYLQLQHRHVFTATATTCLAGLTLLVTFVAFAMYRR